MINDIFSKYLLALGIFLFSCNIRESKKFELPNNNFQVYQKVRIIDVNTIKEYSKKNKIYFIVTLIKDSNDTTVIYSRNIFYRGEYWAETIEDNNGKIISLIQLN